MPGAEHQAAAGAGGLLTGAVGRPLRTGPALHKSPDHERNTNLVPSGFFSGRIFVLESDNTGVHACGPKRRSTATTSDSQTSKASAAQTPRDALDFVEAILMYVFTLNRRFEEFLERRKNLHKQE